MASQIVKGVLEGIAKNPQVQEQAAGVLLGLLGAVPQLFAKLFNRGGGHTKDTQRPPVVAVDPDTSEPVALPDDKIIPPPPKEKPAGYTSLKLTVKQAQFNRELFPDQYTDANKMGLYPRPHIDQILAGSSAFNRRSKIWFDCTPFKGTHPVLYDEGVADGILWSPVYHFRGPGGGLTILRDGGPGPEGNIQILEPDDSGIGIGVTNWRFTNGFGVQINVGEGEGDYEVWVEIPKLGLKSDPKRFRVS